ncbi:MAG: hypothetical protein ABIH38_01885 [Patescibacteria group bacterium]
MLIRVAPFLIGRQGPVSENSDGYWFEVGATGKPKKPAARYDLTALRTINITVPRNLTMAEIKRHIPSELKDTVKAVYFTLHQKPPDGYLYRVIFLR